MKIKKMISVLNKPGRAKWEELAKRPSIDNASLEKTVRTILIKVKLKGDKALKKFSKELDGVKLENISVTEKEMKAADKLVLDELKEAIQKAKTNIEKFHSPQTEEKKRN